MTTRGNGKLPAVETCNITSSCPGSPMAKSRDGIPKAARSCFIASSVATTVMIGRDAFGARQSPWKTSMSVCLLPQPRELPAAAIAITSLRISWRMTGGESSPENSRGMKEKSHRATRRCYESGVETLQHTGVRRLDGYRLYSASDLPRRRVCEARGGALRSAERQHRRRLGAVQGPGHRTGADPA